MFARISDADTLLQILEADEYQLDAIISSTADDCEQRMRQLQARIKRAEIRFARDDMHGTIEDMLKVVELEQSQGDSYKAHVEPYFVLARAYFRLKNYPQAMAYTNRALDFAEKKELAALYLLRAQIFEKMDMPIRAFKNRQKAFNLQKGTEVSTLQGIVSHFIFSHQEQVALKGVRNFSQTKLLTRRRAREGISLFAKCETARLTPSSLEMPFEQLRETLLDNGISPITLAFSRKRQELPELSKDLFSQLDSEEIRQKKLS